jgi:hypothetical protein
VTVANLTSYDVAVQDLDGYGIDDLLVL